MRQQKLILRFELLFDEGIIKRDAEARDLLKEFVEHIQQRTKPKEIQAKIIEDSSPKQGKERLATVEYKDGQITALTTTEKWRLDFKKGQDMSEKFTFFYGGPFSQWLHCEFKVDGRTYNCAEQFMMAEKARLFGDAEAEKAIMKMHHPRDQKAAGRKVKNFDKAKWEAIARDLVYKGNYAKFQQNKGLLHSLTESKGTTLVEASPTDTIWGIGLDADDERAQSRETWRGTNWLGEVLTKVRDDLTAGIYRTEEFGWSQ